MNIKWRSRATLGVSVKNRNDYADYDYLTKLSNVDFLWLKSFHREYVNADFKHKYKPTFKQIERLSIYGLNNSRNRCLYNKKKWVGKLFLAESFVKEEDSIWWKYL